MNNSQESNIENRVREYLDKIGMKRRKAGMIPAEADPENQERFVQEELKPRLKEAKQGRRAVFLSTPRIERGYYART